MSSPERYALTVMTVVLLSTASTAALAWHRGDTMRHPGSAAYTPAQQAAAQKISDDYDGATRTLHNQLMSEQYQYNALLTASSPDVAKINAVAKKMDALKTSLNAQRVKRDTAMAQAGLVQAGAPGYSR